MSKTAQTKVHEGALSAAGRGFAIVASRFNDFIVDKLVEGARDALRRTGADEARVEIFRCPGAMELPGLARRVLATGRFDGLVILGAVIRGATPHFDLVVGEATRGIGALANETGCAVGYGVLACETIEQAIERAGTKAGNKGFDAAMVAVEMADLYAQLDAQKAAEPRAPVKQDLPRRK
ncbi:MAG TPA: 6,7-dimethyl-8-ribityllumazine synthase [Polyangia bacterium]|nr:6,7-dimethyl-8-ribityllumazine synthase [Polyangia bacterium]